MNDAPETAQRAAASNDPSQSIGSPRQGEKRRRCFNITDRLAAAYLRLGLVPEPLASTGNAKAIVRYVEGDHNIPFALGGDTRPQNCNLFAKSVHAAKTAKDVVAIAKSKRLQKQVAEFHRKLFAKTNGLQNLAPQKTAKGNLPLPCGRHSGWKKPLGSFVSIRREKS